MKKTLVALAAISAVTGAMADATIYGTIDQAYQSTKSTDSGGVTTKQTQIIGTNNGGSAIGFKGSEDLGGGLKLSFQQEIGLNTNSAGGPTDTVGYENRNSFIGLAGAFGDFKVGRQYNLAFYNIIANDPMGFSGLGTFAPLAAGNPNRTDSLMVYTAPTMVAGVGVQVAKALGGTATTPTATAKTNDSTSWGLTYTSGGLYVGTTSESVVQSDNTKEKFSSNTVTYDFGMAKVGYGNTKTVLGVTSVKANATSITVPVNATITAFYSNGTATSNDGTTDTKIKASQLGANYTLSKRTYVYLQTGKTSTSGTTESTSGYALGLIHSF